MSTHNKRKLKQTLDFGLDSLDSTNSIKKILDDLHHRNIKAYKYYCQMLGKRHKNVIGEHCTLVGHPIFNFSNNWNGELQHGYFQDFKYTSDMPKMISPLKNTEKYDPVTDFMQTKYKWNQKLLAHYSRSDSLITKYKRLSDKVVMCPLHIVNTAAFHEKDPDKYFSSVYNWYYAGQGNFQLAQINGVQHILHSEFNILYLNRFENETTICENSECSFETEENILETICSEENIIALRTKKKIYIIRIVCNTEIQMIKLKELEDEIFVSINFDGHHKNILYANTLDNKLFITNTTRLSYKLVTLRKLKNLLNNWCTVLGLDRNHFAHISKDIIDVYNKKTLSKSYSIKDLINNHSDFRCNEITAIKMSIKTSYFYICTQHHFFCIDLRCYNKITPSVIQRWTHGMQCPPTYISICDFGYDNELICFTSQWCEDIAVVVNDTGRLKVGLVPNSVTIPYKLPNIFNVLSNAKVKGLCFDLYRRIEARLATSLTGCLILNNDEKYTILIQNSLGDVMRQTLYPEHLRSIIEDDSVENLNDWWKPFKTNEIVFEVSDVIDVLPVWKKLTKVSADYKFYEEHKKANKFSEKEVTDLFDSETFDSGLLEIWNIEPKQVDDKNQTVPLPELFSQ